jgi:hypothetical protein
MNMPSSMCDACVGKGGSLNDEAENVYIFLGNEAPYTVRVERLFARTHFLNLEELGWQFYTG